MHAVRPYRSVIATMSRGQSDTSPCLRPFKPAFLPLRRLLPTRHISQCPWQRQQHRSLTCNLGHVFAASRTGASSEGADRACATCAPTGSSPHGKPGAPASSIPLFLPAPHLISTRCPAMRPSKPCPCVYICTHQQTAEPYALFYIAQMNNSEHFGLRM